MSSSSTSSSITSVLTLKTLQPILFDEKNCIKFLFDQDILYKPKKCSLCKKGNMNREALLFRCGRRDCRTSVSIFKDSFFAKNRITCSDALLIGYLWLCKCTYTSIILMTNHSPNTITNYMKFFRELVIDTLEEETTIIGGENVIVEIDESKFGKRKYHRGHRVEGVWVVGGIERTEEKKCFVVVVPDRSAETLLNIISEHVLPGSIVHTDLWKGYQGMEGMEGMEEMNLSHLTVNHSKNFVDPITGTHTNTIEGLWNGIKLRIPPRNRNKDTIEDHLFEFIWRKKHLNNLWESFLNALKTTGYFEEEAVKN